MDRLVKADVKEVNLVFTRGHKCSTTFKLTNLMHTMSVAVSLTTTNPTVITFTHPISVIPPLGTASFTVFQSQPLDRPPLSAPSDNILVRSSMLPTGKSNQEDLHRLFSKSGPHIFKDATIPVSFVGPHVIDFLLSSSSSKPLENPFVLQRAVSYCNKSQLNSLLRSAAITGNSYFVSALVNAGADVNGESVMSLSVRSGNIDAIRIMIESGYAIDHSVDRFIHDAATMNRVDIMELLCMNYLDIDMNSVDYRGQTALHLAATHGYVEAVQFLITLGSDPDLADNSGWTPLHCASSEGHVGVVDLLLNSSTYAKNAVNKDGKTAIALAVENGHNNLYDMLHFGDVLHRAVTLNDIHGVKICLAEGGKVNGKDQNGWTPLHRAAFKGWVESVELLLYHGARVDLVDNMGYTPLYRAVETGHAQVAAILIAHGARASVKSLVDHVVSFDLGSFKNHPSLLTPICQASEQA